MGFGLAGLSGKRMKSKLNPLPENWPYPPENAPNNTYTAAYIAGGSIIKSNPDIEYTMGTRYDDLLDAASYLDSEPMLNKTQENLIKVKPETDPHGKDLNSPGAKADAGKNRVWLFLAGFSNALEEVAKVTTVGANKYTPNGWCEVPDGSVRYMDAFGRHLLALGKGETMDNGKGGTGCYHKAQIIWNLLASFELELREKAT